MNLENKSVQLYVQVFEDLLEKIKSGYYLPGDQLPTELAMETIYQVSRAPIKQALGKLTNSGLIVRKAGKGTFVTDWKPEQYPLLQMGGFVSQYIKNQASIHCKTLEVENIKADAKIQAILKLEPGNYVVHVSRIRYINDERIFYLNHYLIPQIGVEKIKAAGDFVSLPDVLANSCDLEYYHVSEEVAVESAESLVAKMLDIPKESPVMFIKRTSYTKEYKPIYYTEYYVKKCDWTYKVNYIRQPDVIKLGD